MENVKTTIRKYQVESNNIFGRYLIASDDIKMGEIIFKDEAVVIGPKFGSEAVCLNCYKQLITKFNCCSKCKLAPLCEVSCENTKGWHTESECEMFSKFQNRLPVPMLLNTFHIVTILRCIQLKNQDGDHSSWKKFINMECHLEKRRDSEIWNMNKKISQILDDLNLLTEEDKNSELVQKICGILDINSFELRASDYQEALKIGSICGIYTLAALMAHNCVSNTHLAIDDNFLMTVRASVFIKKGSPIYFNYTDVLQGTINRKEHLREGKYFECICDRCKDPTDFGLHLSSLKCLKCNNTHVVMKDPKSPTQLKQSNQWRCLDCKYVYTGDEIKSVLDNVREFLSKTDKNDPKDLENFLNFALKHFNKNHHTILDAKHLLAGLLRNILNRTTQPSKKMLQRKLEICKDFIPILDVLEPGLSRLKAITLYEIHIPILQIANKEHDSKEITSVELVEQLQKSETYLKEAIRLLLFEPCASPEGILCKRAIDELKMLKGAINEASVLVEKDSENKKNIQIKRMKNKVAK